MGGFTPRFAFEVVFLVLLAIACGLADLRPLVIGLVMGGAWVLMTGIEWLAWLFGHCGDSSAGPAGGRGFAARLAAEDARAPSK